MAKAAKKSKSIKKPEISKKGVAGVPVGSVVSWLAKGSDDLGVVIGGIEKNVIVVSVYDRSQVQLPARKLYLDPELTAKLGGKVKGVPNLRMDVHRIPRMKIKKIDQLQGKELAQYKKLAQKLLKEECDCDAGSVLGKDVIMKIILENVGEVFDPEFRLELLKRAGFDEESLERAALAVVEKKQPKLGTGKRFAALTKKLAAKKGKTRTGKSRKVSDPKALAAWIGRKKYGKEKFQQLSAKGRKAAKKGGK